MRVSKTPAAAAAVPALMPGNEGVRERLARVSDADRLHPCLLFEGPPGVGKAATALWLAQYANCEAESGPRPCGECWSCRQIPKGRHPDVVTAGLDPQRTAPIISVRQARELTSALVLRPYHARRRFVIIDPADAMTVEAANALLKTFEEPPADTGFVLVTSQPSRLLATVRSRSQRMRFGPVPEAQLSRWLTERGIDDAESLARMSEGCPSRALALAEGEADELRKARDAVLAVLDAPIAERFAFAEKLCKGDRATWTRRVARTLDALELLTRDALVVAAKGEAATLLGHDRPELARAWADRLGLDGAWAIATALQAARDDLARFVNGRLVMDDLLTRIVLELGRR